MIQPIAIYPTTPDLHQEASHLASELSLPVTLTEEGDFAYLLIVNKEFLGLKKLHDKSKPLIIDFLDKSLLYRTQHASIKKEALPRAMGLKMGHTPTILDATAGLGRDSFLLASLGFKVEMHERSPIVHALLKNGMTRAQALPAIQNMHLIQEDTINWLKNCKEKPDIIYLDPMFPERKKSALPKQNMLIFHDIVGEDLDASLLLEEAIACARIRVVVKRPRLATKISTTFAPSFSITGSSNRFDVYLT